MYFFPRLVLSRLNILPLHCRLVTVEGKAAYGATVNLDDGISQILVNIGADANVSLSVPATCAHENLP